MRVLVVDDEEMIRGLFREALADLEGVDVDCERSGFRAMASVYEGHYDLVFTDIMMPGLNGVQTIGEIRELQPDVRVIVMTGHAPEDFIEQAMAEGAERFMKKPFGVAEIRDAVKQVKGQLDGAAE